MLLSPLASKSSVTSNILIVNSPATVSRRVGKSRALPNPPRIVYVGSLRRWVNLENKTDKYPESGTIQVSDSCNAFRITCLGSVPWRLELRVSCVRDARRGAFTRFVLSKTRLSMSGQLIAAAPLLDFGSERASASSPALAEAFSIAREAFCVPYPFASVPRRYCTGQPESTRVYSRRPDFSLAPTTMSGRM